MADIIINKKYIFRAVLLFLLLTHVFAKASDKVPELIRSGNKTFASEKYYEASQYFKKALELDSKNAEASYQLAECYRNLFDYQNAIKYYQQTATLDTENAYPLTKFYLGLMQRSNGLYQQSSETFKQFIQLANKNRSKENERFVDLALTEEANNQFVLKKALMPKGNFDFKLLPPLVNSSYNEYGASIYKNDSCIVFSSSRSGTKGRAYDQKYGEFLSDNFIFTKTVGNWEDQTTILGFSSLNTTADDGSGVFNKEKNKFFFTGCYQNYPCQIFVTELIQGKWSRLVALPEPVNVADFNSKQPSISYGGDTLYFSSDRPGGFGQLDIWMSYLDRAGKWAIPINLGPEINTPQNEISPFYYDIEGALFFSSNGHKGYGGFDISFVTNIKNPQPINLGQPFNSPKDDLYIHLGTSRGYLTSNKSSADGNFDLYTFNLSTQQTELMSLQGNSQQNEMAVYLNVLRFFDEKDADFYKQLPLQDKMNVKTYIEKQSLRKALVDKSELREELVSFYELLPIEEKNRIDRLALAKKNFLLKENQTTISDEDFYYYESLPLEKKGKISQIIEAKVFQGVLIDQSQADQQLIQFFEELPLEQKESIERTIRERQQFLAKNFQEDASLEDVFFYQSLSEEQKEKLDRFETNGYVYEEIPTEEKVRLNRLNHTKQFFAKAVNDDSGMSFSYDNPGIFDLGMLAINNPENIKIQGTLTKNQKPVALIGVTMENESGKQTVFTNNEGKFEFSSVSFEKNQKIMFDANKPKFTELAQYALEELVVTVLEDTVIEETFDNIYFDKNQYIINDSARSILDSLSAFHIKHPDVEVKIFAYADTTGADKHNAILSKKRAQEVYKYLTAQGVNPSVLTLLPMGEEDLKDEDDLQYSRRIEFEIKGVSSSYNPTREVYVIQPNPDLKEIATKYNIPLSRIIEMNGGKELKPFTPIRLVKQIEK